LGITNRIWAQGEDEEYRLGGGDVLQLNLLEQPELDRTITIRPDGTVILPRIGSVALGGLTPAEAEELVNQRLRLYDPDLGEVSLTVLEYNAIRIYVMGAVTTPGSYTFTTPPTLWEVIRAAGGPLDTANLTLVRVVRPQEGGPHTEAYDLTALNTGQGDLPHIQLHPGDTVVVPGGEGLVPQIPAEVGVQVFGQVGVPGTVRITEPERLLTVLMMAGTPLVEAKLNEVWWVHQTDVSNYRSTRVNVKLFLEEGSLAGNPLVYPGDTIRVPTDEPGWFMRFLPVFLGIVGTVVAIMYTYDRITRE
jgi:polysaccharide export outer membrane protein